MQSEVPVFKQPLKYWNKLDMIRLVTTFKSNIFTRVLDETIENKNAQVTWLLRQVKTSWFPDRVQVQTQGYCGSDSQAPNRVPKPSAPDLDVTNLKSSKSASI